MMPGCSSDTTEVFQDQNHVRAIIKLLRPCSLEQNKGGKKVQFNLAKVGSVQFSKVK